MNLCRQPPLTVWPLRADYGLSPSVACQVIVGHLRIARDLQPASSNYPPLTSLGQSRSIHGQIFKAIPQVSAQDDPCDLGLSNITPRHP